jgi:hypothetical protein
MSRIQKITRIILKQILFLLFVFTANYSSAQSLPVGSIVLEDYYRTKQLLGELDSTISFAVRPLFPSASLKLHNVFDPDSSLQSSNSSRMRNGIYQSPSKQVKFQLLPLSWQQQYNSFTSYGWNDGAVIPAKGYQSMVSGGVFSKVGPLTIQLQPQYIYAQNLDHSALDLYQGAPDLPVKFGDGAYSSFNWGQSSIRLNFGPVSVGISNENLWWGPGKRNSLLMSNTAQGFKHLTLNTTKPLATPVGFFEIQIVAGKLESSDNSILDKDPEYNDWRYLSSFVVSYQPKWVPGLFLGLTRAFQAYERDIKTIGDYLPFFTPYQKKSRVKSGGFEESFPRDQLTSVFGRWMFNKAHAEVYFEYGANDNAYNFRDFVGSPDHSRAYIFGFSKLTAFGRNGEYIRVNAEITQMSQSIDRLVRNSGSWYEHGEIKQGYTHKGEVLGSGVGPGGNLQSFDFSWLKRMHTIGFRFERYVHDDDLYYRRVNDYNGFSRKWVDLSYALYSNWSYKNLLINATFQGINSLNYQWGTINTAPDTYYIPENDIFHIQASLGVSYRF